MPRHRSLIVCVLVPRFALRVAAGMGGALPDEPVALGPEPGGPPLLGEANAAAATFGVRPACASPRRSPAARACGSSRPIPGPWPTPPRCCSPRLEEPGRRRRVARARAGALQRRRARAPARRPNRLLGRDGAWPPGPGRASAPGRAGSSPRRRRCASRPAPAAPGRGGRGDLASWRPMPVGTAAARPGDGRRSHALGIRTAGELAALPLPAVADRFGRAGDRRLAARAGRGRDLRRAAHAAGAAARSGSRSPSRSGDEFTLRGALAVLIERLARRSPPCRPPAARRSSMSARLAAGGSFRRPVTLREPTGDPRRLRDALAAPPGRAARARSTSSSSRSPRWQRTADRQLALLPAAARRSCASAPPRPPARSRPGWARATCGGWSRWRRGRALPEGRDLLVPFDG